jgi:hypothetical protein
MIEYIYFVKCPGCEDEHFDFFNDAKEFALSCLSQKPIITQLEVNRNDFGECTDSADLGTVWSWEDMMTDDEPAVSIFTKDDLECMNRTGRPCCDAEFDNLDNSIDFELDDVPDNFKKHITESYATKEFEIPNFDAEIIDEFEDEGIKGYNIVYSKNGTAIVEVEVWETDSPVAVNRNLHTPNLMQGYYSSFDAFASDLEYKTSKYVRVRESTDRKPIPEGMTIEQLVEEMEENEDTVECAGCEELFPKEDCFHKDGIGWLCDNCEDRIVRCTWCEDLFDKSGCRYEVDMGWLCDRCQSAIMSRGETLTFKEGSYWDFLDEEADPPKVISWECMFDGKYIGSVKATNEEEAYEAMEREYPEYPYGLYDGVAEVWPETELDESSKSSSTLEELEEAADYRKRLTLCPECGDEHSYDQETSFCLNCGFN